MFLIILVITGLISYKGFNDYYWVEQYKFSVEGIRRKEYIRLLSSGFLHADWEHLIFNMLSLYFFSDIAIDYFGTNGFLLIYFGAMITANLMSYYLYRKQSYYSAIGASGAVSGIIFASIALAPSAIKVNFLPGWLFGLLYFSYSVYMMLHAKNRDNIGHSAHIGGALFGLAVSALAYPELLTQHLSYIGIMAVPLGYMFVRIYQQK